MMRSAITRLREQGYGFMSLAMRIKFAELERSGNLTVFALDDHAIFMSGRHDYVAALRLHIVPGQRLTSADLLRLTPGMTLPTLAGHGKNLSVTHSSFLSMEELRINYVAITSPEMFTNPLLIVHGVCAFFPVMDGRSLDMENAVSGDRFEAGTLSISHNAQSVCPILS
jgi:hypothetical protein